jgi:hypothetical protein
MRYEKQQRRHLYNIFILMEHTLPLRPVLVCVSKGTAMLRSTIREYVQMCNRFIDQKPSATSTKIL